MTRAVPSSKRSRKAPSGSNPSNVPETRAPLGSCTVSGGRGELRHRAGAPVGHFGGAGEIDADPDHRARALALEQQSAELGTAEKDVVGPLQHELARSRQVGQHGLVNRQRGDERQRGRRRVLVRKVDHGRAHEVARRVEPPAALPALARGLPRGDEPVAFGHMLALRQARYEIGVGGAGFGYEVDQAARNSAAAARSARSPSGPLSR